MNNYQEPKKLSEVFDAVGGIAAALNLLNCLQEEYRPKNLKGHRREIDRKMTILINGFQSVVRHKNNMSKE